MLIHNSYFTERIFVGALFMHIKPMPALCWCLLFVADCPAVNAAYVYVWMQLYYQAVSLTLTTKNLKQQIGVGLNYHWEWTLSLPCLFFLPDSPIYLPQQLREGLWRDTNERKHNTESCCYLNPGKETREAPPRGDRLCFTATCHFCSAILLDINTHLILKHLSFPM